MRTFNHEGIVEHIRKQEVLEVIACFNCHANMKIEAIGGILNGKVLENIALNDSEPKVRLHAARKITDEQVLAKLVLHDSDIEVRCLAISKVSDQSLIRTIVLYENNSDLRCAAMSNLEDQSLLEYLALNDCDYEVRVNAVSNGVECFMCSYLDQLLTYGTAVGEIVPDGNGGIAALYNSSLDDVEIENGESPLDIRISSFDCSGVKNEVQYPELILCSAIMPEPGKIYGTSILSGLPFVTDILLKIFSAVGTNWERVGNVRFAVNVILFYSLPANGELKLLGIRQLVLS